MDQPEARASTPARERLSELAEAPAAAQVQTWGNMRQVTCTGW
jgi:hypothetical protein